MKVITGSARGMRLTELPGNDTRPTLSRVKEALFSIIQFDIEGRRVLDLFAGTGQLGIEALSRGAAHVVFVDSAAEAIRVVRENLQHTRLAADATVLRCDSLDYLKRAEPFDIIFVDPPYNTDLCEKVINFVQEFDILKENGIMVCESVSNRDITRLSDKYSCREYKYGKVKLTVFRNE